MTCCDALYHNERSDLVPALDPFENVLVQQLSQMQHSIDDLLAASAWAQELSTDQLQRVRAALVVRDVGAGGYVCYKGDQASVWMGVALLSADDRGDDDHMPPATAPTGSL
jgi:heme oxygenase